MGIARGIDAAAHKAALKNGTIGVIAGGTDNIYPKENKTPLFEQLYKDI
ncbi:MAG: DNA-protecting protein DprA [Candidatus Midichloria sp.]|nr:DNA-protecting protein DprA [Candidatus Midichloria sp.]